MKQHSWSFNTLNSFQYSRYHANQTQLNSMFIPYYVWNIIMKALVSLSLYCHFILSPGQQPVWAGWQLFLWFLRRWSQSRVSGKTLLPTRPLWMHLCSRIHGNQLYNRYFESSKSNSGIIPKWIFLLQETS